LSLSFTIKTLTNPITYCIVRIHAMMERRGMKNYALSAVGVGVLSVDLEDSLVDSFFSAVPASSCLDVECGEAPEGDR